MLENKKLFPVEKMCYCLKVSKNAYYHWLKVKDTPMLETTTTFLKARILALFKESRETYGSLRLNKMLEREKLYYSRSYVAVLMRELGLRSVLRKKFVITTDSNHSYTIAKNILNRDFKCDTIGKKWVSDITYIRVNDDWNYLTTIMDLADRKIVGWSLSEDMTVKNTVWSAWLTAIDTRKIKYNFIFHSDQGVQYASNKMSNVLRENIKITQSMSRKGNCWDNATAESLFKTIKYECTNRFKFTSNKQLFDCLEDYIRWYNTKRIHSTLGYKTPLEMQLELEKLINKAA
jgi:putative transposase|tara:strand:+ start:312 stop:1181 length:870 start_codon:yes stop_codon:yes gene_type:complete